MRRAVKCQEETEQDQEAKERRPVVKPVTVRETTIPATLIPDPGGVQARGSAEHSAGGSDWAEAVGAVEDAVDEAAAGLSGGGMKDPDGFP